MPKGKLHQPPLLTRAYFRARARPLAPRMTDSSGVVIGLPDLRPKEFTTGSLGWDGHTRMKLKLGDCYVWVQVNLSLTITGSKDLPTEDTPAASAG